MKKKLFWKRSISMLLSVLMVVSVIQFVGVTTVQAAPTNATSYITMPITIRDFAADGMLFEFNQVGLTGTAGAVSTSTYTIYSFATDYTSWINGHANGLFLYKYADITGTGAWGAGYGHLMIVCDSSGNIVKVVPKGTAKGTSSDTKNIMSSGYYVVWCSGESSEYSSLSVITDNNKGDYNITYSGSTLTVKAVGAGNVYNQADTAGFSLLSTSAKDHINNLPTDESKTIDGTDLIQNGTWGLTTDPDPITATLNSGASQQVYGAWIRTDLVQPNLVNGKMVYTKATVKYLAEYMQQIMAVPEQNSDGTYNTYFVTGKELSELDGETLAAKIRAQVTGGLGTYTATAEKKPTYYTQVETWFDAAYFLLHNTFNDSIGYGKTVSEYKNLHLVQTTNDDGETCYVFNSKYDDTKYDYQNGEIYNTQTDKFTIAKTNSGTETYVRGNPLPEPRFDPLGVSGAGVYLGYGMSGDTYGDMVSESTADWAEYYDNTNYHLSLEGHAQFIYYEDDNLYFTFTGDDDVYLFINGIRVLDVGAAHSISKVEISLNEVAALCGLSDGKAYDFDFFYMERHGTAANFGIETNIKIVDPAMTTTKEGFQNKISTGYNGYVDPLAPVYYSFGLENKGEAPIEDLTFKDDALDVYLSKDTITLNGETKANRQYLGAIVYNADGTTKSQKDGISDDELRALLDGELAVGEQIIVYGFQYTIPTAVWTAGNGTFPNTVYTTAVGVGDNAGKELNGMADWKVQKREYKIQGYHVYEWLGKSVTLTRDELLQPLVKAVNGFTEDGATIVLSSASGATTGTNINANAKMNSDGGITYTGVKTGADTFYYKVTEGAVTAVIGVAVYTYDVADNTYVIDYGLPVELNGKDHGFMVNDTVELADNPNVTEVSVTNVLDMTKLYGEFAWNDEINSLKYTPSKIINNVDSARVNVQVLEEGETELNKFTGVAMYETVTTAPASVMYYEENYPDITYNDDAGTWTDDVTYPGESMQSADQDMNYGYDPNYELEVDADSEQDITLVADDSNGTIRELTVATGETRQYEVMSFDFCGTGFEILSRTTQNPYAVINVQVYNASDVENGTIKEGATPVKQKPVITESKGGDLYQIPVISITELGYGEYHVVVKAARSTETAERVLYIDGVRIYNPLSNDQAIEYYNLEEAYATFAEIKKLIAEGEMIYADINTEGTPTLISGHTLIEDVDANFVLTEVEKVEDYLKVGPNNELYLDGGATYALLAFTLTPEECAGTRNIQIGAHRKTDTQTGFVDPVTVYYGRTAQDIVDKKNSFIVNSGTEMYYDINLQPDEDGICTVLLAAESPTTALALTNIKYTGYSFESVEVTVQNVMENRMVAEMANYFALRSLSDVPVEEPVAPTPIINEDLEITSVSLKATKKIKGGDKTENRMMLTVKTTAAAETVVICDASGNALPEDAISQLVRKETGNGKVTFTVVFTAGGKRGEELNYSVTVYDSNGYASVNTETVTVTVK